VWQQINTDNGKLTSSRTHKKDFKICKLPEKNILTPPHIRTIAIYKEVETDISSGPNQDLNWS